MKKNLTITTATASALLALQGCSTSDEWDGGTYAARDTRVCVDDAGNRVFDINCRSGGAYAGGSGGYYNYYLPRSGRVPYYGDSVYDPAYRGSYTPPAWGQLCLRPLGRQHDPVASGVARRPRGARPLLRRRPILSGSILG